MDSSLLFIMPLPKIKLQRQLFGQAITSS
jgi:hypothetical protein